MFAEGPEADVGFTYTLPRGRASRLCPHAIGLPWICLWFASWWALIKEEDRIPWS